MLCYLRGLLTVSTEILERLDHNIYQIINETDLNLPYNWVTSNRNKNDGY